jgi:hypothetical protein
MAADIESWKREEILWIGLWKRRLNRGQIDGAVTSETSENSPNMIALRQG